MAYVCKYCGATFSDSQTLAYHEIEHAKRGDTELAIREVPKPTPERTPEPAPEPVLEFGEYVTHKTPEVRPEDSLLGKVLGYLSELLFWADIEGKCRFIDVVVPDEWWCKWVQDFFISIFKGHYNANYQTQYNRGADQGNKFHTAIFGWIDDAKSDLLGQIEATKRKIETELISPIKAKIREIEPTVNDLLSRLKTAEATVGDVENRINDAVRDLEKHTKDIGELFDRLKEVETKVSTQGSSLEWFKRKVEGLL